MQRPLSSPRQITQPVRVRKVYQQPMPSAAVVRPAPRRPMPPAPPAAPPNHGQMRPRDVKKSNSRLWLWLLAGVVGLMFSICAVMALGVGLIYAGGILPGVEVAGINIGGMPQEDATVKLANHWSAVTFRDGVREWSVNPAELGITFDAAATAARAYQQGRGEGNILKAIVGGETISPVMNIDYTAANAGLNQLIPQFELAPVNAGVQLVNGHVETTPPQNGRMLDIGGTIARLQSGEFADGTFELAMFDVQPGVTDSTPMVAEAERLLTSFLDVRVYDPVTGDFVYWSLPPDQWASWLTASPNPSSATGLSLSMDGNRVSDYLQSQAAVTFDNSRYVKVDEGVSAVQQAISEGRTTADMRVYHNDRQHVVQSGETIISVAWDYGVPYPYIQSANPGVDSLSPGQTITVPSPDNFLLYPVVPDKRIVVSISQQRAWVYENGAVKWEWPVSTGISSSPTWPGVYQIISHEPNAYAGNWDLWMPDFMGVYRPIPGSDFTNGFHGFPTRGGGQLLWENSLGTRVTYGCILLSNTNVSQLYDWAQEGVVVEIQS